MIYEISAILLSIILMSKSADVFTNKVVEIAKYFKIPVLLVSLTLVPIGSSVPELAVSLVATFKNSADIALGNVVGSNIANFALALAIVLLFTKVKVSYNFQKLEIPLLFFLYLIFGIAIYNNNLGLNEAIIFTFLLIAYIYLLLKINLPKSKQLIKPKTQNNNTAKKTNIWLILIIFSLSLALIIISSNLLIWGAKQIAVRMKISQQIIGLTIVAIGTSLPEIAISIASGIKKQTDILLGNILGSCIYNIVLILATILYFQNISTNKIFFWRDYSYMLLYLVIFSFPIISNKKFIIGFKTGAVMLILYIVYLKFLF